MTDRINVPISQMPEHSEITGKEFVEVIAPLTGGAYTNNRLSLQRFLDLFTTADTLLKKTIDDELESLRAQIKSSGGKGIQFCGIIQNTAQLPLPTQANPGDIYLIDQHPYILNSGEWLDLGDYSAPSNYQLAQLNGYTGTEAEWLESLHGKDGIGLRVLGSFTSKDSLPTTNNASGDAYIVEEKMFVWDGNKWSTVGAQGPAGKNVYELAVSTGYKGTQAEYLLSLKGEKGDAGKDGVDGKKGETGEKGEKGEKGDLSFGVVVKGNKATIADLPTADNHQGDAWGIDGHLWVFDGTAWNDLGSIKGIDGEGVFAVAKRNGFTGTEAEWLATLKGPEGKEGPQGLKGDAGEKGADGKDGKDGSSAYQIAVAGGFTGTEAAWLESLRGPAGATLTPKGTKPAVADLPAADNSLNDMWVTEDTGTSYVWDGSKWINLGQVRGNAGADGKKGDTGEQGPKGADGAKGEKGDQGPEGKAGADGAKGDKGDKGDMGAGIVILGTRETEKDLPTTGDLGQGYLVGENLYVWTGSAFTNIGPIRGPKGADGAVGEKGADGARGADGVAGAKGENGNVWIVLSREPQITDGQPGDYFLDMTSQKAYLKATTTSWSYLGVIGGGNVYDAPNDDNRYVRHNADWVTSTLYNPPTEEGMYVYSVKAGWIRFNDYDLAIIESTGACDVSKGNVFHVDVTVDRYFSFSNLPANRAKVIVLVCLGSGGSLSWDPAITWHNSTRPVFGKKRTNIVFLWDGTYITGAIAHKLD